MIHGGARGLDTIAAEIGEEFGFKVIEFPADWKKYGKAAGPIRNREMLDMDPDLVLAFHSDLKSSKGTKDCVRAALQREIEVILIESPTRTLFSSNPRGLKLIETLLK